MDEKKPLNDEKKPWDRLPDETVRDFARFEGYRLLGPDRSVGAGYRIKNPKKEAPASWFKLAIKNRWKERAESWDLSEIERERIEFEKRRKASKDSRIKVLEGYLAKLVKAAATLDPAKACWANVSEGLSMVLKGLREEFGEATKVAAEVTGANGSQVQFVAFMPAPIEDPDEWAKQAKATTGGK